MSTEESQVNLLSPADSFRENYAHQLQQTIEAYSISMIVLGEALQNAIDAVCEQTKLKRGKISVEIDFDSETVKVTDNGGGFPRNISLLYLGGGTKSNKKLKGKVGVGIKVSIFSSEYFCIRSKLGDETLKVELNNCYQFKTLGSLSVPTPLPDDPEALPEEGTQIIYRFPKKDEEPSYLKRFVQEITDTVLPRGIDTGFGRKIRELETGFPSLFSTLLASFLRRYSYVGDVLAAMEGKEKTGYPAEGIEIKFTIHCNDAVAHFGNEVGSLFGAEATQSFTVEPSYLRVEDSLKWVPKGKKKPMVFTDKLGNGGKNLTRSTGFNSVCLTSPEEYESLLKNAKGQLPENIEDYKRMLFPKINALFITIGRIPDFEDFLPGGSRRLISCNGVITSHDIDLTRGRNQEYVRCFDLVIDLNAQLNYGKTQLTNMRLVKLVRDYINEAYVRVIQPATGEWVGKIPDSIDEDTEIFMGRDDLGLPDYATRKVPHDENDVIGLFFEMLGHGMFPSYRIFGLSQKDKYDCRAAILREKDKPEVLEPSDDSKLRIVEFKVLADEVIRDFDRLQKFSHDIDLVIAWSIGNYESKNYAIYDIDQSSAYKVSPKRVFPEASKYIHDAKNGQEVQIVLLEEVVSQLKNKNARDSA